MFSSATWLGLFLFSFFFSPIKAAPFNEKWDAYNINRNPSSNATMLEYFSEWANHTYNPSPPNGWRSLPFYSFLVDRFADGDPTNNDYFHTMHEWDLMSTQERFGGDVRGLASKKSLDYLQGMGIRAIYIIGSPFLNKPWQSDQYGVLDQTILDPHLGNLEDWRFLVDEVHRRGMYLVLDFTQSTMGDMIGFENYLDKEAPFTIEEHNALWKQPSYSPWGVDEYLDFKFSNDYNESCTYPAFWNESGHPVPQAEIGKARGCRASEFDQYGDIEAFGVYPDWKRQLSKFASVQDRLREWQPNVGAKLNILGCLVIDALDIDGVRLDKAMQMTVDYLATFNNATRECALARGKRDFLITGEITASNDIGSVWLGRGRTPEQRPSDFATVLNMTSSDDQYFLRPEGMSAVDSGAFHYSIYRCLTRFLGMDGNLGIAYDVDINFINAYNLMLTSNDFVNPSTGQMDPRHLFGTSNQDVFRWPALVNGTQKNLLANFITTLLLPGINLVIWGEEQDFYALSDTQADNYLFNRQSMSSSPAWKAHGCYKLGSKQYYEMPLGAALDGCKDDWNRLDHFDVTSPSRLLITQMNWLRSAYSVLQDGLNLVQGGNWTSFSELPGSSGVPTEFGLWTAFRSFFPSQTSFTNETVQQIMLLYTNLNHTVTHDYDCSSLLWISTPFQAGARLKNLFFPYETYELGESASSFYANGTAPWRGCLSRITLPPHGFAALVLEDQWQQPVPKITSFEPGHDARLLSQTNVTDLSITFGFDQEMDCDSISSGLQFISSSDALPYLNTSSILCTKEYSFTTLDALSSGNINGALPTMFRWSAQLLGVYDGVHAIILDSPLSAINNASTAGRDHFMFRKGTLNNPMVFHEQSRFNPEMVFLSPLEEGVVVHHTAPGADLVRFSSNYGQSWSSWERYFPYTYINKALFPSSDIASWHLDFQYYNRIAQSSAHMVSTSVNRISTEADIWPKLQARGSFNQFGYDLGVTNSFNKGDDGLWHYNFMNQWPQAIQLTPYDILSDFVLGDIESDGVLDKLPPNTLASVFIRLPLPAANKLSYHIAVNASSLQYQSIPAGDTSISITVWTLFTFLSIMSASISVIWFNRKFYPILLNKFGFNQPDSSALRKIVNASNIWADDKRKSLADVIYDVPAPAYKVLESQKFSWPYNVAARRKILIATMEYEIFDTPIKVKIGGLGVMSTLMGKVMKDVDLFWMVPTVKDFDYDQILQGKTEQLEPFTVTLFSNPYLVKAMKYVVDNVTYVIVDSPIFRKQTKAEPYPQATDDLASAIYYSTYNQCIAQCCTLFKVDLLHLNDYHCCLAPIYLLPKVIPVALSLHNAEFQTSWSLKTRADTLEVCLAFNLKGSLVRKYCQAGTSFNMLAAAAAFIAKHQESVGVAGVSDKYGKRSFARYSALWILKKIESLPNPDPSDLAELDKVPIITKHIRANEIAEKKRPESKKLAQEWAGLEQNPDAELFFFVGRWSKQKGVDLIADVFTSLLATRNDIQLVTIGPTVDLYGQLAAVKLQRLMEMYPTRVCSKPVFTQVPACLQEGSDFALMPSRDEPFGLVAIEAGRKGALGVGSLLGGLGLAPGFWFPVESDSTDHLLDQFTRTVHRALKTPQAERAILRARSAVLRFPTLEWRQRIEDIHRRAIVASNQVSLRRKYNRPSEEDTALESPQLMAQQLTQPLFISQPPSRAQSPPLESRRFPSNHEEASDFSNENSPLPSPLHSPPRSPQISRVPVPDLPSIMQTVKFTEDDIEEITPMPLDTLNVSSPAPASNAILLQYPDKSKQINASGSQSPSLEHSGFQSPYASHTRQSFSPEIPRSTELSADALSALIQRKLLCSPIAAGDESFQDKDGSVALIFKSRLENLNTQNTTQDLCIEKYIVKNEKAYFRAKRHNRDLSTASVATLPPYQSDSSGNLPNFTSVSSLHVHVPSMEDLQLPKQQQSTWLEREILGWPIYTIFLAFGQFLAVTTFQLTLLSGTSIQADTDLYIIGATFIAATFAWFHIAKRLPAVYVFPIAFFCYGLAFLLVGLPSASHKIQASYTVYHGITLTAQCLYAVASAAFFLFFAENFGSEAGSTTPTLVSRAAIIQGLQTIWTAILWKFGFALSFRNLQDVYTPPWLIAVTTPLSILCFVIGALFFFYASSYYRTLPPYMDGFFKTLFRRKLVLWFLLCEVLRNYWLSAPYGRTWQFLWSSQLISFEGTVILCVVFFVFVWGAIMLAFRHFSKDHSWLLPIFAIGLLSPRWAQIEWAISGIGLYLPWANTTLLPNLGNYLSVSLWLWLAVLDAVQGVGLGLMLLQTLSRQHVGATLALSQVIGASTVMLARGTAPDRHGAADVFINFAFYEAEGASLLASYNFWLCLLMQLVIPIGFFVFYRKEQLFKP